MKTDYQINSTKGTPKTEINLLPTKQKHVSKQKDLLKIFFAPLF